MQLSKNFTLEELTHTDKDIPNIPNDSQFINLQNLCQTVLQPIWDKFGRIHITSGFRSKAVNKAVGGKYYSQHTKGEAADIIPLNANIDKVMAWIVNESGLQFGQCILEMVGSGINKKQWIHISLPRIGINQMALIYDGKEYTPYG